MAVATFAAGIMYQSTDNRVVTMRAKFMDQLRRNWTWIFCSLLAATMLPILGLAVGSTFPQWGVAAALVAALLVTTNLLRVVYLLRLILLLESVRVEEHVRGQAPADKY
ncbi:hypothetical protein ACFVRT_04770 [Arthrobacter koreensis]|uniref:hypothetical protein n=1 Tax=Arthrobacter koreensis TaxID=199136 RepID=UPI0036DF5C2D